MITHIHATTIVVSDHDKAIHYFCDVLGWKNLMMRRWRAQL